MPTHVRLVVNRETTVGALNMRRVSSETRVRRVRASQTLEPDSNRMNRLSALRFKPFTLRTDYLFIGVRFDTHLAKLEVFEVAPIRG